MQSAFQLEHIRARQHGGQTAFENLAWCCRRCNLYKGPNASAFDPVTDQLVRLFNPRIDRWDEHFEMDGPLVVGLTPEGRATVALLQMNDDLRVQLRGELLDDVS